MTFIPIFAVAFLVPLAWQVGLFGLRTAIPYIIRWIALDYAMDKAFELGVEKAEEIAERQVSEEKYQSFFSKFIEQKNSIPYEEAKVFVFINIPEHETIINNYKNRGAMYKIFNQKIYNFLDDDVIKGSDVLAFRDLNHLKNSKLFPKNINFFKLLAKNGSFYYFYGDNFFFIYIIGNNIQSLSNIIKNYFFSKIPLLRKQVAKNNSSIASIKQNAGESASSILLKDRFRFVRFPTIDS